MSKIHEKEEYGRAKAYFDNLLADTEPDMLPEGDVNNEPASAGSFRIPSESIAPESVAPEIGDFCEENSLTKTAFFHAVFAFVLGKYNLSENVLYITACSSGSDTGPERTVTVPDMTFPVVCHLDGEQTVTAFVRDVDRQLADSMDNDTCSFEEIAREHQIAPDVVFTCQGGAFPLKVKDGEPSEERPSSSDETGALLHVDISEQDGRLLFSGEYRKDRYSEDYINRMVACLQQAVREFLTKPVLKDVCLTDAHTCAEMDALNATETDWLETDIVSMFRAAAEKYPDRRQKCADLGIRCG